MKQSAKPNARLLMTHSAAWHTLFSRNDHTTHPDPLYSETKRIHQGDMKRLIALVNKDPGRIHTISKVALVGM